MKTLESWRAKGLKSLRLCTLALSLFSPLAFLGCSQETDTVARVADLADSADQMLIGMRTAITNLGVRQANLEADTAFLYENAGRADLKKVKVTFFAATGAQTSVLTADTGVYFVRSGQMEAHGNVLVVRSDGARLTTTFLKYDQNSNQVSTDKPYKFDEGSRHGEGQGFTSDPTFSNIRTRELRGTGGGFTLPGQ